MGKPAVITLTLLLFAVALVVLFTRDEDPLSERLQRNPTRYPRIVLEDFTMFQSKNSELRATVTGRLSNIYDPNIVEISGDVRGTRILSKGREEAVSGETATAWFDTPSLTALLGTPKLTRAEMRGFVEISAQQHIITADHVEFDAVANRVFTTVPVRVEGPSREFTGESGFNYDVATEKVEFPGKVHGIFRLKQGEGGKAQP